MHSSTGPERRARFTRFSGSLLELSRVRNHDGGSWFATVWSKGLNFLYHLKTLRHPSEDNVFAIQPRGFLTNASIITSKEAVMSESHFRIDEAKGHTWSVRFTYIETDKELRSICVRASIGHRKGAFSTVLHLEVFVLNCEILLANWHEESWVRLVISISFHWFCNNLWKLTLFSINATSSGAVSSGEVSTLHHETYSK